MKKIGILYIATGKYIFFWKKFFISAENFFLKDNAFEIHYFVFTNSKSIYNDNNKRVHIINQEALPWPYITLNRFSIFLKVKFQLEKMDYLYFFNANMLFVDFVGIEIIPSEYKSLIFVKHPGFYNSNRESFTYEIDSNSTACISSSEGDFYFMGGLNGGKALAYLEMVEFLEKQIEIDKKNGIIAIWHDESHLNRYAVDNSNEITVLDPSYGYPQGLSLPFPAKIMIRDKSKFGGHEYLRSEKNSFVDKILKFLKW